MKKIKDELLIALDFGTTNIKGAVFNINGNEIFLESIEYPLIKIGTIIIENDLKKYWEKIFLILKNLSKKLGARCKNVVAIGTTSQGETIVPVNKLGNPLRNAIVWLDTRTSDEVTELKQNFNINEMYKKTGCSNIDASWPATRILWMRKNEPEVFKDTYKFLLIEDFCVHKLSGVFVGESSVYSSSYYYDIFKFDYIDAMLSYLNIKKNNIPEIVKPGTIIGEITEEIHKQTGFPKNTKVVIGAMDQICGAWYYHG